MASDAEPSVTYILGIPRWIWGIILNIVGQVLINFGKPIEKVSQMYPPAWNCTCIRAPQIQPTNIASLTTPLGTNVMKYGHGLSPPEPPKDSRLPGSPVPHRLSMDDYDFTETDFSDSEVDDDKKARSKGKWMKRIGSLLFITGGVLNFVSMGFAAQSLLASLGSVQFVTNVVFGKFVLGELVTARTWLATVVIMSGNLMIVFNSNRASVEFTANQLFWAYTKDYKYYMAAAAASLIVIQFGYIRFTAQIRRCELKSAVVPKWLTTGQGMCYALFSAILGTQSMLQAKCMSELLRLTTTGTNQMTNPFTYGVIFIYIVSTVFWLSRMNYALQVSGDEGQRTRRWRRTRQRAVGARTPFFASALVRVLRASTRTQGEGPDVNTDAKLHERPAVGASDQRCEQRHKRRESRPLCEHMCVAHTCVVCVPPFVHTCGWVCGSHMCVPAQHYDGLFIIPVLQVFWLVLTIVSGGIYFQEFKTFGTRQMTGFSCGVLVLFVGVYMLMPRDDGEDFSRMDDDDDDLHIDINVEVNEDFAGKSRRHSSDPALPEGLPPLGEGIGGGDDGSPKRERVSSGGERQSHSRVGKKKVRRANAPQTRCEEGGRRLAFHRQHGN